MSTAANTTSQNPFEAAPLLSLDDQIEDLQNEIDRLRPTAETGEQWAHLCWLEARKVNLRISGINSTLRAAL